MTILVVRKGPQVRAFVRFENKDSHGSVLAHSFGRLCLTVSVETRFLARSRDGAIKNCLFASSFTEPPHRVAFLASCLLGGLFVEAPPFHFTEDALTLHFLFQNPKSLLNIVVSHKDLQSAFLVPCGIGTSVEMFEAFRADVRNDSWRSNYFQVLRRCLALIGHLFILNRLPLMKGA